MTKEKAREYAETMTFRDAINNLIQSKCVPYRKATFIKIRKLLKMVESNESILDKIRAEIQCKANSGQWSTSVVYGMNKSIEIIDKYRAESEKN